MAQDLGVKHTCFNCGTKFYDLRKPEPICPKCGADVRDQQARAPSPVAEKRRAHAAEPPEVAETEEAEVPAEEAEESEDEESADEAEEEL